MHLSSMDTMLTLMAQIQGCLGHKSVSCEYLLRVIGYMKIIENLDSGAYAEIFGDLSIFCQDIKIWR